MKKLLTAFLSMLIIASLAVSASAITPKKTISDIVSRFSNMSVNTDFVKFTLSDTGTSLNVYGNNPTASNNANVWLYTTDNSDSMYWTLIEGPENGDWYVATKLNTEYTLNLNTLSSNNNCDIYKLSLNNPDDATIRFIDDNISDSYAYDYIYLRKHNLYLTSETLSTTSSGKKSGNAYWSSTPYTSRSRWSAYA